MNLLSAFLKQYDAKPEPFRCFECKTVEVHRPSATCSACEKRRVENGRRQALAFAWRRMPGWQQRHARFESAEVRAIDPNATEQARSLARELVERKGSPTITFTGDPGNGKTTLACAMVRELISAGTRGGKDMARARGVEYVCALDLASETAATPLGQHCPLVETIKRASVLLLDEVGRVGRLKNDPIILEILHKRHRDLWPTIMTSPFTREEMVAEMAKHGADDGGFVRRVYDDAIVVHVGGKP